MELTRYDCDWLKLIPHQHEPSSMMLRGRSFTADRPLTVASWRSAGVADDIYFGCRGVGLPGKDIGFRVVLERPQP